MSKLVILNSASFDVRNNLYRCRVPFAVYISDDCQPDLQYIPDTHRIIAVLPPGGDLLAGSMTLLREAVESNAAVAQFEVRPALLVVT